jgi:hypothetical protein
VMIIVPALHMIVTVLHMVLISIFSLINLLICESDSNDSNDYDDD